MVFLVSNVLWNGDEADPVPELATALGVKPDHIIAHRLVKKSLDARQRKKSWRGVYRVEVEDDRAPAQLRPSVRLWTARDEGRYGLDAGAPQRRNWPATTRPIVVGAGPAGLFAALYLAEAGAQVTLLERGEQVEERVGVVNGWWRGQRPLDSESNLVFGEGGAGTFSDGKIYTRRRDGELGFIFRRLVDFGASPDVLREAWAHLGTDRIRAILPPFRERLRELGVDVRFGSSVSRLLVEGGACVGVVLASGEVVRGGPVLVGVGHSARDGLRMMVDAGALAEPRSIAVGVRVEHPQAMIDEARYGTGGRGDLPPASYRLTHSPSRGRKGHTFCMCPGGMVVPATNHPERVVVNGMSFAARRAYWANSAVIVEVTVDDFRRDLGPEHHDDPLLGFSWQDRIEAKAFELGGSSYAAPAQRVCDFLKGRESSTLPRSSYPMGLESRPLGSLFPDHLSGGLSAALRAFEMKIPGFTSSEGLMIAPETRTTSPVRFIRDARQCSVSVEGLYPIGEGAGYAGGIVSSALDGLRAARAITLESLRA